MVERQHLSEHSTEGKADNGRGREVEVRQRRVDVLGVVRESRRIRGRWRASVAAQIHAQYGEGLAEPRGERIEARQVQGDGVQQDDARAGALETVVQH